MAGDAMVLLLIILGLPCLGVLLMAVGVVLWIVRLLLLPVRWLVRMLRGGLS